MAFGRGHQTLGFDVNQERLSALRAGHDHTGEVTDAQFGAATGLTFSSDPADLSGSDVFIVTVPTPVDEANQPDLGPLRVASETVGRALKPGAVVVFESTVYPGTTEEVCVPILEKASGLRFNADFFCGYSPERINPGDRVHTLETIIKITSGSSPEAAAFVDALYAGIIPAGTHLASSIRVAEAAKVIENTQRDVNIALINELAMIFNKMGIDTREVLAAAGTKWNFLPFRPGLVGGHCIGVDPYYLTHKASVLGYHPELMLAARRINSRMGIYVAHRVMALMASRRLNVVDSRILVLGLTFKEDCPDLRNTRVVDLVREFEAANARVDVFDPWVDPAEAGGKLGIGLVAEPEPGAYDAVVLAVAHRSFRELGSDYLRSLARSGGVFYDIKHALPEGLADERL
ncbi:Vi polysaccharide biosynthesis UDP-N-acetylglucosamine C-6 dehydrogenase TviB [Arenimonas aestuarii]